MIKFPLFMSPHIVQQFQALIPRISKKNFIEYEINNIIAPKKEVMSEVKNDSKPLEIPQKIHISFDYNGNSIRLVESQNTLIIYESLPFFEKQKLISVSQKILHELDYELLIIKCQKSALKKRYY